MEANILTFGISFRDSKDHEYYATVYKSKHPTTLYAVHFNEEALREEYEVLTIGVALGELVIIHHPDSSIPNISYLVGEAIKEHLEEINEPIE